MQTETQTRLIGDLSWAKGSVGAGRVPVGNVERQQVGVMLARHTLPVTSIANHPIRAENKLGLTLPIGCMDDRLLVSVGLDENKIDDPDTLRNFPIFQLPGGADLATAKAAVLADLAVVRDQKDFVGVLKLVSRTLKENRIINMPHDDCGARKYVKTSIDEAADNDTMHQTLLTLGINDSGSLLDIVQSNNKHGKELSKDGFFDSYTPEIYDDLMRSYHPETFTYLKAENDEMHGHYGSSVLFVQPDHYFDNYGYHQESDRYSFALTLGVVAKLASLFCVSEYEYERMVQAYPMDTLNVAKQIVMPGMPVYQADYENRF